MKNIVTLAALVLLSVTSLKAQEKAAAKLQLLHHSNGSSVALRWAPTNKETFDKGVNQGYRVVRKTMVRDSVILPVKERTEVLLGGDLVFPYTDEQINILAKSEPKAAPVYEIIYGETAEGMQNVSPAAIIQKRRQTEMVFGLALFSCDLSPKVARAAGLYAIDTTVRPNERYLYMVSLAEDKTDTASVFVVPTDITVLPKPLDLRVNFGDKVAMLEWNTLLYHGVYSAYMVERSSNGRDFTPVSKDVIVGAVQEGSATNVITFQDSLPQNDYTYYYRLRGFSPFGVYGQPSDVVQGKGEVTFVVYPQVGSATLSPKGDVTLHWSTVGNPKLVKGYIVERAQRIDGEFVPLHKGLLSAKKLEFTHKEAKRGGYYRVVAVGFYEAHRQTSFPYYVNVPDDVPPTAPTGLAGDVDSLGIVSLTWKTNPEEDVAGYRVFSANSADGLFVDRCTQTLSAPVFADTLPLNTLTSAIYYKVLAIDHSYNYSKHSAPFMLYKPDTIPPTAPRITQAQQQGKRLLLTFARSHSTDVADYKLYYSLSTTDSLRLLHSWGPNALPATFTLSTLPDTLAEAQLWLFASDRVNNLSRSEGYTVQLATGVPCKLEFTYTASKSAVKLMWKTQPCRAKQYRLYKNVPHVPATLLQTLPTDTLEYVDTEITYGTPYRYILEAISPNIEKAAEVVVEW
ncbi:MAG: hypothetical protein LBU92_03855 [Prevotellaceae bacterium]|nr:hypothetical protein [Prevotellaceae bacterium]